MALTPGWRLGVYEVTEQIGAGGMGEVYRATDSNLKRSVAIKVLPASVAGDADRLARFQREAEVLAALNHPNIAAIYGLEKTPDFTALVMELVEGEDLSQHIARGAIPLGEALPIARQIADAVEAAHEQGIIHRDLKPANIKVRADGTVKVLDFGLAKAMDPAIGSSANAMNSPTLSMHATQAGIILGTAAYMSPEQAAGKVADKRSDLWAFGVVLLEMLTGRQAFGGETVSHVLAAVLKDAPDWTTLPAHTPATIRRLLRRCLEKDRKRRLDSAAAARLEIDDALTAPLREPDLLAGRAIGGGWRRALPVAAGAVLGAIIAVGAMWWRVHSPDVHESLGVRRLTISIPEDARISGGTGMRISVSPDGRTLIYTGATQLYRRAIDGFLVEPIRGTEGARFPFFSPDSQWIGFEADGHLRKVPTAGGLAMTICAMELGRGRWADDGTIIFSDSTRLYRVSAAGGVPQPIAGSDARSGETIILSDILPGAGAVVFQSGNTTDVLAMQTGQRKTLIEGVNARFVRPGYLVFSRDATIWAASFDVRTLTLTGSAIPVVEQVRVVPGVGVSLFTLTDDGTLAYMAGTAVLTKSIVSLDRRGRATPLTSARASYAEPRVSPDGRRLAVVVASGEGSDIWVYELDRGTRLRLTTTGLNRRPIWSPDGKRIAFMVIPNGGILSRAADGSGENEVLLKEQGQQFPDSVSPDGLTLIFNQGFSSRDLWKLPIGGKPSPLLTTPFSERTGAISPDGRWLSYVSDQSRRDEVYLRPYPDPGGTVAVSTNGGTQSVWSRDGRELFYRAGDSLMAIPIQNQPFQTGTPVPLFPLERRLYGDDLNVPGYDVFPDGKRFVAVLNDQPTTGEEIRVVLNWVEELKARVPTK